MNNRTRLSLFTLLVLTVALLAAAYVWRAMAQRATQPAVEASSRLAPNDNETPAAALLPDQSVPTARLLAIDYGGGPESGRVTLAPLMTPNEERIITPLRCDRVHFAAKVGICLLTMPSEWLTPVVSVTLFSETFQTLHSQRVDGMASRARVAPDGRYAAFTVFVSGHSYADDDFSTATHIIEVATGQDLGNLEDFTVWRDGAVFAAIDFNFWGVTFANDSNRFYATLQTAGVPYLVEGDIAARRMTVLHAGVECPALSPDNRRVAFKKARGDWEWQITVLDLATMTETALADPHSVDDQVEWLDNRTVLYQQQSNDDTGNAWINIMRLPADGNGEPTVFAVREGSPVVVN